MAIAYCPSVTAESCHEMANSSASPCDPLICCERGTHPSPSGKSEGKKIPLLTLQGKERLSDLDWALKRWAFLSSQAHTRGHSLREKEAVHSYGFIWETPGTSGWVFGRGLWVSRKCPLATGNTRRNFTLFNFHQVIYNPPKTANLPSK